MKTGETPVAKSVTQEQQSPSAGTVSGENVGLWRRRLWRISLTFFAAHSLSGQIRCHDSANDTLVAVDPWVGAGRPRVRLRPDSPRWRRARRRDYVVQEGKRDRAGPVRLVEKGYTDEPLSGLSSRKRPCLGARAPTPPPPSSSPAPRVVARALARILPGMMEVHLSGLQQERPSQIVRGTTAIPARSRPTRLGSLCRCA